MQAHKQVSIVEAAAVIHSALHAVGCEQPVEIIDHGRALRIGTFNENLTVLFEDNQWKVLEYTPHLQRTMTYDTLEECAHDIAMCDEHGRMFHQVDQMEQEIDEAIAQTETRLHLG
jgi:hypothetical protein